MFSFSFSQSSFITLFFAIDPLLLLFLFSFSTIMNLKL